MFDDFGDMGMNALDQFGQASSNAGMGQLTELLMAAPELITMIKGDEGKKKKKKKKPAYYTGEPEGGWDSIGDSGLMNMTSSGMQQQPAQSSGKPGLGQMAQAGMGIYKALQ